jgi:hypothetical protein
MSLRLSLQIELSYPFKAHRIQCAAPPKYLRRRRCVNLAASSGRRNQAFDLVRQKLASLGRNEVAKFAG